MTATHTAPASAMSAQARNTLGPRKEHRTMDPEFSDIAWTLASSNGYARVVCTRMSSEASELLFRARLEY